MIVVADGRPVEPGAELPAEVRFTTTRQLVQYAGAADDPSGIHYDSDYARLRGFPNVIVHGFLKAAFLSDLATRWAGPGSWFVTYNARYQGVDLVGAPITCRGRVVDVDAGRRRVSLELWTENAEGRRTTTATGTLQLTEEDTEND
ncbi:MaoC/PaaZ C-terminal domain-containing protein [Microbacterium tumbae]